jgi:hypothetical protein
MRTDCSPAAVCIRHNLYLKTAYISLYGFKSAACVALVRKAAHEMRITIYF